MIKADRTYKVRDWNADSKNGKKAYKEKTSYPSLTIVGKPELGQLMLGEEVIVKIKLRATGYQMRRDYDSDDPERVKIPEASFDVLEIEVPSNSKPISKKVFSDKDYDPIEDIGKPCDDCD